MFQKSLLVFPFDSIYIQPVNLYEMELGSLVLFSFKHALFFFPFSSVSGIFGVLGVAFEVGHLGWGVSRRAPWDPFISYCKKFLDVWEPYGLHWSAQRCSCLSWENHRDNSLFKWRKLCFLGSHHDGAY